MRAQYSRHGIPIKKLEFYNPREKYLYFIQTFNNGSENNLQDCPKFHSKIEARKYVEKNRADFCLT